MTQTIRERLRQPDLAALFLATAGDHGETVAVRDLDGRLELTYARLSEQVGRLVAALRDHGVRRGDTVAMMMVNRPEFFLVDLAVMFAGAIPFSLYNSAPASQLAAILADARPDLVFADAAFAGTLHEAKALGAPIGTIVTTEGDDGDAERPTLAGMIAGASETADLAACAAALDPDAVATIIYTSGSTGLPKGVELTHANLVAEVRAIDAAVPMMEDGNYISVLPAAHIGDRARCLYGALTAFGHTVTTVADPADLLRAMREVRPIYFGNPPRTWEKFRAGIVRDFGADIAERARRDPALALAVRTSLGLDRVRWISTGSAPTQPDQFAFFESLGIRLCELWGMTETCAIATTNTPDHVRFGSVGRAIDGLELRTADDGELLVRGPTIARRYRNRPADTAEAFDADGWFRTGDLAECDADGYWHIVGRKKDIIINAAGKNMSPTNIEAALRAGGPAIMQVCVVGDRRPYNVALIVAGAHLADASEAEALSAVQAAVDAGNRTLSRVEQIKRFALLRDEWLAGGDELTPTMKMKRRDIEAKYASTIEGLYA